jgi:hypothetical protein
MGQYHTICGKGATCIRRNTALLIDIASRRLVRNVRVELLVAVFTLTSFSPVPSLGLTGSVEC